MNPTSLYSLQQGIAKTIVGGRLERESDTELRWNAYENYSIGLYNGESWEIVTPSGVVQAFNDSTTISGATLTYDTNYDVYAKYESADNFTLEFQEWAGATSRYEDPQRWQGIYVRDLTASGIQMRYLGVIRLDSDSGAKFKDEKNLRFISNLYNRVKKSLGKDNPYSSNNPDGGVSTSWESWDNDGDTWKVQFISNGVDVIDLAAGMLIAYKSGGTGAALSIGIDSKSPDSASTVGGVLISAGETRRPWVSCDYVGCPVVGYHYAYPLCKEEATGSLLNFYLYWDGTNDPMARASFNGTIRC